MKSIAMLWHGNCVRTIFSMLLVPYFISDITRWNRKDEQPNEAERKIKINNDSTEQKVRECLQKLFTWTISIKQQYDSFQIENTDVICPMRALKNVSTIIVIEWQSTIYCWIKSFLLLNWMWFGKSIQQIEKYVQLVNHPFALA